MAGPVTPFPARSVRPAPDRKAIPSVPLSLAKLPPEAVISAQSAPWPDSESVAIAGVRVKSFAVSPVISSEKVIRHVRVSALVTAGAPPALRKETTCGALKSGS